MPYIIQRVQDLYEEAERNGSDVSDSDLLGAFLSSVEADGFRLVGVIPDHQNWDEEGQAKGKSGTQLILHRGEPL